MKKNYFKLVIFLFAFLTFIANIDAEFPNKIGPMGLGSNSSAYNGYNKFVFLKANGKAAYCVLYYADRPEEGDYCNLANDWSDPVKAGVAAIINKANASNSDMTKEYYYADLAMNEFLYVYNDEHNINNGIVESINTFLFLPLCFSKKYIIIIIKRLIKLHTIAVMPPNK